ncbi:MAG TPA: universal stress protein [Mycobacteriales bacterium]|nr:universal stress protein [Mycobacteriales bacterium]
MPENTYTTVLVGTDGSASSLRAVERAAEVARRAGGTLLIACATREDGSSEAAENVLRGALERARAAGDLDVDSLVLHGDPVDELTRAAHERDADLVVVGNRGMNGLAGRLLGSVPSNLSHRVRCDVLIAHTTGRSA